MCIALLTSHPTITAISELHQSISSQAHNLHNHPLLVALLKYNRNRNRIFSCPIPPCYFFSRESQQLIPKVSISPGREIIKSAHPAASFSEKYSQFISSHTSFYTDGSKTSPGCYVGLAIFSPPPPPPTYHFQARIFSYASIFTAEALAILLTLEHIKTSNIRKSIIFTDSLSTLQALSIPTDIINLSHITIFRIKSILLELEAEGQSVVLAWIPGRKGIPGNERADSLAKEATRTGILLDYSLPHTDFHHQITIDLKEKFSHSITNPDCTTGQFYIDNCLSPSPKPWYHSCNLPRDHITTFSRMRSNHYNLAFSLFRKNLSDSPECQCGDIEDLNHVFWSCPRYDAQRAILTHSLIKSLRTFALAHFIKNRL